MSETKINPKMLTLARESRGLMQGELAEKLKTHQSYISKMELEQMTIADSVLEGLEKVLKFPKSFFMQDGEIYPPLLNYRKRDTVAQKLIMPIEARTNIYRLNIQSLLRAMKYPEADIPALDLAKYETIEQVAKQLRKHWKVPKGPIENLSEILESNKVILTSFDFETERVDGRTILTEDKHPIIFTNSSMLGDRQRFTLAYEIGHLVMHAHTPPDFNRDVSHEANVFAAAFLMPEKEIKSDLEDEISIAKLAQLKRKWKVSMQSLVYRANDLKIITDNQKRYLLQQFNQLNIRRREPVELDIPKESPVLLRNLITKYKTTQGLNVKGIAGFFNLETEEFTNMYS
jgi:Zn-dependent peptidase ImmA (M78 family)